jgi:hypothetical protein
MDWRCILFIVKCLEAYYPESLNVMLIHNGKRTIRFRLRFYRKLILCYRI